jgi:hypothetical protein
MKMRKRKAQALSARKLPPGEGTRSVSATEKGTKKNFLSALGDWRRQERWLVFAVR